MARSSDAETIRGRTFILSLTREAEARLAESARGQGLVPVDCALLDPEANIDFPIYLYDQSLSSFVQLKAAERASTVAELQKLWRGRSRPVFVPRDFAKSLTSFAASNLRELASKPDASTRQVYAIAKALLTGVFSAECDLERLEESSRSVSDAISDLIDTGGDALRRIILAQSHDPTIYTHSLNVCVLGTALSSHLRLYASKEERRSLAQGFLLHDLGKMDISPEILLKPTKLTTKEFEEIKMHPIYGYERVKELKAISERGRRIVLEHHERCDGSGYPHGLTRDQISEAGRICAIVESYEDLTSERPYHKPVSVFQALKLMQEEGMGKYDTAVFKAFINFFRSISISSFR